MKKAFKLTVAVCAAVLYVCAAVISLPLNGADDIVTEPITVRIEPTAVDAVERSTDADVVKIHAEPEKPFVSLEARLTNMLNINYCYGSSFSLDSGMITAASVTLADFADDLPDRGLCLSAALLEGFIKNFYGNDTDIYSLCDGGLYEIPCMEVGTQCHEIISVTESGDSLEVISRVTFYYGGSDLTEAAARSVFVKASESDFGYNLKSCELF